MLAFLFAPILFAAYASAALLANPWLQARASGYPACETPCLSSYNPGNCSYSDLTCLCQDHTFLDTSSQCLYDHCTSAADIAQAVAASKAACLSAGVTLTSTYIPTQSLQPSSPAASSSSTGTHVSASTTSHSSSITISPSPSSTLKSSAGRTIHSKPVMGIVGALAFAAFAL